MPRLSSHTPLLLLLLWLAGLPSGQAQARCDAQREVLGNAMQEARLAGDTVRLTALEEALAALNQRCRGMVALQRNHQRVEAASRQVSAAEAALREALGDGDSLAIGDAQRQLDEARAALEAARRGG